MDDGGPDQTTFGRSGFHYLLTRLNESRFGYSLFYESLLSEEGDFQFIDCLVVHLDESTEGVGVD